MHIDRRIFDSGLLKRFLSPVAFVTESTMLVFLGIDTGEA